MEAFQLQDATGNLTRAGTASGQPPGKKEALNRAVLDAEQRLGHLMLEGSPSPESAGMMTLLIRKVRDLRAEMGAIPGPIRNAGDPPRFDEI